MRREFFCTDVNVPGADEFAQAYPQYGPYAKGDGAFLFELLTAPASHLKARVVTEDLGLPAVAGVAEDCKLAAGKRGQQTLSTFVKQFIGAVVCASMMANGFEKTGTKRAIPHKSFTKGEVYRQAHP